MASRQTRLHRRQFSCGDRSEVREVLGTRVRGHGEAFLWARPKLEQRAPREFREEGHDGMQKAEKHVTHEKNDLREKNEIEDTFRFQFFALS